MKICPTCARRFPDNVLRCPEDGTEVATLDATTAPDPDNLVGRRMFGDYAIVTKLGEGGMGAVYLAEHRSIGQRVAIKVLHGQAAESSELVQRFNREAKAIARLTHPNIIRVFIFGHTPDGLVYLAMEFVEGGSLRDLIERRGRLSERHAIYILKQVLGALSEAHELGIIHRDLKPDNILLTEYRGNPEFVKVVDFGIAKVSEPDGAPEAQLTQAGVVYGTPEYLSPEQAQAHTLDGRSDLYSLGVILWEMVTGDVPFLGSTAMSVLVRHVYDPPGDPRETNPNISAEMAAILDKVLQKDPAARFQTAHEFLEALKSCEVTLETRGQGLGSKDNPDTLQTAVWTPPPGFLSESGVPITDESVPPTDRPVPDVAATWQGGGLPETPPDGARRAATIVLVVGIVLLLVVTTAILVVLLNR